MSVGYYHAIAWDHAVVPKNHVASEEDLDYTGVGTVVFHGDDPTIDTPEEVLIRMGNAARLDVQQELLEKQHRPNYDPLEVQLDFLDAFMNLLISGTYKEWEVPADVLETYKAKVSNYRMTMDSERDHQYLDIILNVQPDRKGLISSNIDMNIGNHHISKISGYSYSHPSGTSEIQSCDTSGAGRKRIGFALFHDDPGKILRQVVANTAVPPGCRQSLQQAAFLKDFWSNLAQEEGVLMLTGTLLKNWNLAIGVYEDRLIEVVNQNNARVRACLARKAAKAQGSCLD
ncbi:hypothetical protein C8R42DRAFT_689464 [Lentinula raphanica]|nr:hypothetical protein C8R42DRAFT_689464 [Lentinula raphanica]